MSFRVRLFLVWLAASLLVGVLVRPLEREVARESDVQVLAGLSGNLGQGVSLAVLGGYRNVAANLVWIAMYGEWQYRRVNEVLEKMQLAVALNPNSLYFWIDGARIIANDMPVWQVGDDEMERLYDESDAEGVAIRLKQGRRALRFLDKAPAELEDRYEIPLERGTIYWQKLGDLENAIAQFGEALEKSNSPYFVSRVYAELLVENGRTLEAYEYLKKHYATLPDDDHSALKPLVAQRIAEIGAVLGRSD
ncbi:tetratricopeptide repeat protein [Pelagicoccus mobilis]|uniref:Tetratricopeptide repeat protein n=1 Tax=Pelagicoccus mobilis TaxID=415221 RepID=A0A934RVC7_9BACT|nr:tetratricopeptide repeat protein [Pelagicoccus mobilis]MBK1877151.1 tetratricopeptide repeat protein [Pelagicoccus mobilis]